MKKIANKYYSKNFNILLKRNCRNKLQRTKNTLLRMTFNKNLNSNNFGLSLKKTCNTSYLLRINMEMQ